MRDSGERSVDALGMLTEIEAQPEVGQWAWQMGPLVYEVLLLADGVVAMAMFIEGELAHVWDEPVGVA